MINTGVVPVRYSQPETVLPMKALVAAILFAVVAGPIPAQDVVIENTTLAVRWSGETQRFSLLAKPVGRAVIVDGVLSAPDGTARQGTTTHATFGRGDTIEVSYADGHRDVIAVFPDVPFALLRSSVHNGGGAPSQVRQVRAATFRVDLGKPLSELRALGTGGLQPVEKGVGSYMWLTVAEPATRHGVVAGWITSDRGSGVLVPSADGEAAQVAAHIDYGRLQLAPGATEDLETLALGYFDDARLGLEAYADAIAKVYAIRLPPQRVGYCTWYAEEHGGACDEQHLAELTAFAAQHLKPFGFDFIQIDDKWQNGRHRNGPAKDFTTHRANGPYPHGMKGPADDIQAHGLMPGIWFMPFAGDHEDPLFKDHLDWFAKDAAGKPFETRWGGTCLDMTQPGAREHLRGVVQRIAHEWGYQFFKMDGLWTGTATRLMYVNDGYQDDQIGEASLQDLGQTHIEAYRNGLKLVREVAGPDVFLLGCCVSQNMRSFGGAFGLVDAMRVGPDTGAGHIGTHHGSRQYFLHGRVWLNDPDCVSVRAATPLEQARVNASWTAITGQLFYNSDWLPALPAERVEILKRTMTPHGLRPRPVDLFDTEPAQIWLLTDTRHAPRRDVVAFFNWDAKKPTTLTCAPTVAWDSHPGRTVAWNSHPGPSPDAKPSATPRRAVSALDLPPAPAYVAFDFWANRFVPPTRGPLVAQLPPASCQVLAVRPVADHPQLLSTSRHVTQGIVDVLEERWDAAAQTLSGVSRLVADDPYELRIIVPVGPASWKVQQAALADADRAAGATIDAKQDGPKVRVSITCPASRDVGWQVRFAPAAVEPPAAPAVTGLKSTLDYAAVTLAWDDSGADRYRVSRSDGTVFETSAAGFRDAQFPRGQTYRYTVQAMGWDGGLSAPAVVEVTTPEQLKRPPTPPVPDIHLSDLEPVTARTGWGKIERNRSCEGKPLTLEGVPYDRGMGVHANALLVYAVPSGAARFVAVVGLDDEKRDDERSSVTFEVYGDVKELGEAPVLLAKSPPLCAATLRAWTFDCELSARFKELRLVVTDADDGIAADHADWANAGFLRGQQ